MIDIIVEALNQHSKNGFYVLHKSTGNSIIKSFKIDIFNLYLIKKEEKKIVFTYSRTRSIADSFKKSEEEASKQLILFLLNHNESISN